MYVLGLIEIEVPSREILWDQQAVSLATVSRYNADDALDLLVQEHSARSTPGDVSPVNVFYLEGFYSVLV